MAPQSFARKILPLAEQLLDPDSIEVETMRSEPGDPATSMPDVRVTHVPTGHHVVCADHGSQIENMVAALLALRAWLDQDSQRD